jgi:hypothetical protein
MSPRPRRPCRITGVTLPPTSFARLEELADWTGLTLTQIVTIAVQAAAGRLDSGHVYWLGTFTEHRAVRKTAFYLSDATRADLDRLCRAAGVGAFAVVGQLIDHLHFRFASPALERVAGPGDINPDALRRLQWALRPEDDAATLLPMLEGT